MAALGGQLGGHGFGGGLVGHQQGFHLRHRQVFGNAHQVAWFGNVGAAVGGLEQGGVLVGGDGLGVFRLGAALFCAHQLLQAFALQAFAFRFQVGGTGHGQFEGGAVHQGLGHLAQVLLRLGAEGGAARGKGHAAHFFTPTKGAGQQAEGRGKRLADEVEDDLANHRADAELGVVQRAADGQIQVDHAAPVGQQRSRQAHGQAVGRARHGLAKGELVQHDAVAGGELPVGQHLVGHVHTQLAAFDAVACVLHRVGRERGQVQVAHLARNVQRQRLGQGVELARDLQRGRALGAAQQLQRGQLGFATRRFGRERPQLARQLGQVGRVIRFDEKVGKQHLAVDQAHGAKLHHGRQRVARRGLHGLRG